MHSMKPLLRVLAGVALSMVLSLRAGAGPSFNPDRDELAELSGKAGAKLHQGLQKSHEMLMFLELRNADRAASAKDEALKELGASIELFKQVADKAPNQKIIYKPKDKNDEAALASFKAHLDGRKIQMPSTERELASLAAKAVSDHAAVLRSVTFKATKADYNGLRKLLRSQATVLDLGILSSIVWTVSIRQ